ncbi:MAG: hypothetical protein ABSA39_05555 [Edaphobacter sp.]
MKPRPLTLALLFLTLTSAAQTPLIGIYEGASSGATDNQGQPGVRVLFRQSGRDWRSFNAICQNEDCLKTIGHLFPHATTWNLVQSGQPIAKVTATTPPIYHSNSEIGVQAIDNPASVSNLEPRLNPNSSAPTHTILATTLPTLTDPDNWRHFPPVPFDLTHTQQAFRHLFPHPVNCDNSGRQLPRFDYTDNDIHIDAAYQSHRNWRLLQVTLSGYRCDGPPEAAFLDQWFAISPSGEVRHIGHLMQFAGAADFAHTGQSELLFSIPGNNGGYRLFYDDFNRTAQATATHH